MAKAKFLATAGEIFKINVKIGYAMAALPSGLEPAIKAPKIMVRRAQICFLYRFKMSISLTYTPQIVSVEIKNKMYNVGSRFNNVLILKVKRTNI